MKSFKSFISEEVLPTANVEDGHFSLENDAARADINAILAGICSKSHVTPYVSLRKISKALAYFSIILPKRTFLEGEKGIEVYEMMQFGAKIGMNDQGEFINQVPEKYYLFFQYRMADGKYTPFAKVVDKTGLDKLLSMAEVTMSEDCAYDKVTRSQRNAPRDPMFSDDADGSESTKKAVATSLRKKERKLANGSLDDKEYDPEYVQGIKEELDGEGYETNNQLPDFDEEVRVTKWSDNSHTARVSKDGKVLGVHTRKKHSDLNKEIKSRFGLKGNIPQGEEPGKAKTHKIDELSNSTLASYLYSASDSLRNLDKKEKTVKNMKKIDMRDHGMHTATNKIIKRDKKLRKALGEESDAADETNMAKTQLKAMASKASGLDSKLKSAKNLPAWVQSKIAVAKDGITAVDDFMTHGGKKLDEKLTKKMSAGDVISDFIHSKNPKFKGKSKKERQKMALGAYYGMHKEQTDDDDNGYVNGDLKKRQAERELSEKIKKKVYEKLEFDPSTEVPKNT